MKKLLPATLLSSALSVVLWGCSGETAKDAASKIAKKTVEVSKGTLTGIEKGIEDGRKAAESTDGALIISTGEELNKSVSLSFVAVCQNEPDQSLTVDMGFENRAEMPIRIVNLNEKGKVLLLDKDGFAYELIPGQGEITVPPKAKIKSAFSFRGKAKTFDKIRIYGIEFSIPTAIEKREAPRPAEAPNGEMKI